MGEILQAVRPCFNRSLCIEHRSDRLTGDPGAIVLREILERSGIVEWMMPQLRDPRRQEDVVHDLASLIRTSVLRKRAFLCTCEVLRGILAPFLVSLR